MNGIKTRRPAIERSLCKEREGFEPSETCAPLVFKTSAFDHSAIFPKYHCDNAVSDQTERAHSSCVVTPAYFQLIVDIENERGRIRTYSSKEPDLQSGATLQLRRSLKRPLRARAPKYGSLAPRVW